VTARQSGAGAQADGAGDPPPVLTEVRDRAGILTLNRPAVRNALNQELRARMQDALERFDEDGAVAVVVVTGAGGVFSSGRDLKEAAAGLPVYPTREAARRSFSRASIRKPVIAAVEGYALGGGFELVLGCDLIVAARDARFGLPEVKRNLVAIGGGLFRLPKRVPYHMAMELALTGDAVPAERLDRYGLFAELAEPGQALAAALALAGRIAASGPSAVRATKEIVRSSLRWPDELTAFDAQLAVAAPAQESPDRQEGIIAFLERREPRWTDW
jgi:enoyl-CoA hydratase